MKHITVHPSTSIHIIIHLFRISERNKLEVSEEPEYYLKLAVVPISYISREHPLFNLYIGISRGQSNKILIEKCLREIDIYPGH